MPEPGSTACSASRLPGPGRVRLAPMLSPEGRLKGDLTALQLG